MMFFWHVINVDQKQQRTVPCGTPDVMLVALEWVPSKLTSGYLSARKSAIHLFNNVDHFCYLCLVFVMLSLRSLLPCGHLKGKKGLPLGSCL